MRMTSPKVASTTRSAEVQRLFSTYADRAFVFVRPGGNAGDHLIYMGAEKIARQEGLTFSVIGYEEFLANSFDVDTALYLHGGGGYNPIWSGKPIVALERATLHKGVVIQGPQTYWDDLDFLRERIGRVVQRASCERLVMMAREETSYRLLRQAVPESVETILDHDTALNLSDTDLARHPNLDYNFYAIREDKEALPIAAREYTAVWGDPVEIAPGFDAWLSVHASASEIVTNRLHSAILGSIMGIPTTLCPNSYFKNRAVWEYSLRHRGVKWADEVPITSVSRALHQIRPVRWLLSSRWAQKRLRRALGISQ